MVTSESTIIVSSSEWRQRVIAELAELTERIVKLRRFMTTDDFYAITVTQAELLYQQSAVMNKYADILVQRLGS